MNEKNKRKYRMILLFWTGALILLWQVTSMSGRISELLPSKPGSSLGNSDRLYYARRSGSPAFILTESDFHRNRIRRCSCLAPCLCRTAESSCQGPDTGTLRHWASPPRFGSAACYRHLVRNGRSEHHCHYYSFCSLADPAQPKRRLFLRAVNLSGHGEKSGAVPLCDHL